MDGNEVNNQGMEDPIHLLITKGFSKRFVVRTGDILVHL